MLGNLLELASLHRLFQTLSGKFNTKQRYADGIIYAEGSLPILLAKDSANYVFPTLLRLHNDLLREHLLEANRTGLLVLRAHRRRTSLPPPESHDIDRPLPLEPPVIVVRVPLL